MSTRRQTGEELARDFEERRGDISMWAQKPSKIRVRRGGPSTVFSVRFAREELNRLQEAADKRGRTISELIRTAALREVTRQPFDPEGLEQAAVFLRQIADLISSQAQGPQIDRDTRMAESFVAGKVHKNVPKPIRPPVFASKRDPRGGAADHEEPVRSQQPARRKKE
jgi:hypothetical protein